MRTFEKVMLLVGAVTFGVLLWKMDVAAVAGLVFQVGWGMVLIVLQEAIAHLLNAVGWRFAFAAAHVPSFSLAELFRLRVTGDAINYLTPSATIAGEITRTTMLNQSHGAPVRATSVLVAKCTQTLGQIIFILFGLMFVVRSHPQLPWQYRSLGDALAAGFTLALAGLMFFELRSRYRGVPDGKTESPPARVGIRALGTWLRLFFRAHPGRFAASTLFFVLGYAWGAVEAFWICHFLGVPVSIGTAVTIEVLSTAIDSVLFMVPAKLGTQEGGKTAIFAWLGLSPTSGLAFGIVRHVRELVWAGTGLLLYNTYRKRGGAREPSGLLPKTLSP